LSKSGSAQFLPTYTTSPPTNRYASIPGGSVAYDGNGNLTNDVTHSYTWDADGDLLKVDGSTVVLTYDAMDRMVEQTRGSSHTEVAYSPFGAKLALMNGQSLVNAFAPLPGGGTAVYNSSGLAYYRHPDHLGNSRLATTPTRTKYYDVAYAPYGEDYNGSGTADLSFTTQNQDTVGGGWTTNLYDFLMREYRTGHGRWTSPDPAGLGAVDPTTPQTWNRYAYVSNNPLSFIDPLGLQEAGPICWNCGGGGGWGVGGLAAGDSLGFSDPFSNDASSAANNPLNAVYWPVFGWIWGDVDKQAAPLSNPLPGQADSASIVYQGYYFGVVGIQGWENPFQPSMPVSSEDINAAFCVRYGGCEKTQTQIQAGLDLSPKAIKCTASGMGTFVVDAAALIPGEGVAHALFGIALGMVSTPISAAQGNTVGIVGGIGGIHLSALELTGNKVIKEINPIVGWAQYLYDYRHIDEDYNKCMGGH
jgi:RHS repeat-associated protein